MADENMAHDESGSISPAGRFARMEAALGRIEDKLDLKADTVALESLERDFLAFRSHVSDLESGKVQSAQTVEAMKVFQRHTDDIDKLKRDALIKDTQLSAAKEAADKIADARFEQMKSLVTAVSIVSGFAVIISSGITILSLLHII